MKQIGNKNQFKNELLRCYYSKKDYSHEDFYEIGYW
jgi:hypothetical protein